MLCQRCILHEGFLGIRLNSEGLCSYCADPSHENQNYSKIHIDRKMKKEKFRDWKKIIEDMKENYNQQVYDCVIGYSGGKDSTALVDTFITEYKLKPLLITVDTGFMTDIAKQNIQDTLSKMNLHNNHIFIEEAIPTFSKLYKYFFFNHISNDKTLTVEICHACTDLIHTIVVKEAIKRDLAYVIIGFSPDQISRYFYETKKEDTINDGMPHIGLAQCFDENDFKWYLNEEDISGNLLRVIYPYHVIEYSESEIINRIESKGLIEIGKGDPVLTNCHVVKAALMHDFFRYGGITYALQYAELVRQEYGSQYWKDLRKKWLRTVNQVSRAMLNGVFNKEGMEMFFQNIEVSKEELMEKINSQRALDPHKEQILYNLELIKGRNLK